MQGLYTAYCDVSIRALLAANRRLMQSAAMDLIRIPERGKGDTLNLDIFPEIIIEDRLKKFDTRAILVTEETNEPGLRWPSTSNPERQPPTFFCDPTDRSKFLHKFLSDISQDKPTTTVGELMAALDCSKKWEEMFEGPVSITGATSAITFVSKGKVIFTVIFNYITNMLYVAYETTTFQFQPPNYDDPGLDKIDLNYASGKGKTIHFPPSEKICTDARDYKRFVTFLGKTVYPENFRDSAIFTLPHEKAATAEEILQQIKEFLHHNEPGGPSRVLYLSELQDKPIGFVMANGEKIGEWLHWLAFVKYSRDQQTNNRPLRVFEIALARPWTKDGSLMSTTLPYSIFCEEDGHQFLDLSRLRNFASPNKFRSMLVVTQEDNDPVIGTMREHGYREITEFI